MRNISVVGAPGSGKTTTARRLASRLGVEHIELDALYHQAGWEPRHRDEFRADVRSRIAGPGWVVDGNYSSQVRDLVWAAADTVVWLDPSRPRVMTSVLRRTLTRAITRRVLWNGNRESVRNLFSRDPEQNLMLWTWTRFGHYRETYAAAAADPALGRLSFVHLRSRREARRWVSSV